MVRPSDDVRTPFGRRLALRLTKGSPSASSLDSTRVTDGVATILNELARCSQNQEEGGPTATSHLSELI